MDIIEKLRAWHSPGETITGDVQLYLDAADEIERLRGRTLSTAIPICAVTGRIAGDSDAMVALDELRNLLRDVYDVISSGEQISDGLLDRIRQQMALGS